MNQRHGCMMLATLGGQPQLITFALDALLARGENIREVIVLYLSDEKGRVNAALAKLTAEFTGDHYTHANHPCRLRPLPIRDGLSRLPDIRTEADAHATWEMLRDLIITLKNERHHLHVCVSGGRRMMSLVLTSAALLHFSYQDKMWHIFTPRVVLERARHGALMHARPEDGVRLIQVPLVPLGTQFPVLRDLAQGQPPAPPTVQMSREEQDRCQQVVDELTPRQLETLRAFADGLSPQQVAARMDITLDTVNTHRKAIVDLCRNVWPEQESIRYHHLREWFAPFFNR